MDSFYYDETSPSCLRWASARSNMKAGDVAGSLKPDGYWKVRDGGHPRGVHIVVWEMHHGDVGLAEVDHIDGNPGNNRLSNLRLASRHGQCRNASTRKDNTTGVKGVTKTATGYCARVQEGATRHQKTLPTIAQAAAWVRAKREEVHGEFTKHS